MLPMQNIARALSAWEANGGRNAWRNTECNATRIYVRARVAFNRPYATLHELISLTSGTRRKTRRLINHSAYAKRYRAKSRYAPSPLPCLFPLVRSLKVDVLQTEQMHRVKEREKKERKMYRDQKLLSTMAFLKEPTTISTSPFRHYAHLPLQIKNRAPAGAKAPLSLATSRVQFKEIRKKGKKNRIHYSTLFKWKKCLRLLSDFRRYN